MPGNTFGTLFKLTTFGESHGVGLGGVVDGCPAGVALDEAAVQAELDKRKPGQGGIAATTRKESDTVKLLSGVFEGATTGTSIGFVIYNENQRSKDYEHLRHVYRPGHGDVTYQAKYGVRDHRGGGRSSGRETVSRVAGGAVALAVLRAAGIGVHAYTVELGSIPARRQDVEGAAERPFFSPDPDAVDAWTERVKELKGRGETLGGVVEIRATGVPAGLGEPVFDKLDARLAYACMSVGAVKGVEIGSGFEAARSLGGANNDPLTPDGPGGFATNNAGGVLAGISSGQEVVVRCAVKPIPSIAREQNTVNSSGQPATITIGGRHDISAIPRVVPVLRAMVALTLADFWVMQRSRKQC